MIPYIFFLIAILIAYHYKAHKIMFIIMTLFAALRFDVGWDYAAYIDICSDQLKLETIQESYSYPWYLLFDFAYRHAIPEFPIFICAIITQWCTYKAFRLFLDNDNKKVSAALLFYICWPFFYLNSFSIIRQSLSISIILLAFAYIYRKHIIYAIVLWIFAVYLHPSASFSFPILILLMTNKRLEWRGVVLCIIAGIFVLANIKDVLSIFEDIAGSYMHYLEDSDGFGSLLTLLMIGVCVFMTIAYIKEDTPQSIRAKLSSIILIGAVIEVIILSTSFSSVLIRVMLYFSSLLSIVFFENLHNITKSRIIRSLAVILLGGLFVFYLIFTYDPLTYSASSFIPYKSILFQN